MTTKNEKILADLHHYMLLEKQMEQNNDASDSNDGALEKLTEENIKFCSEALDLFTIEEKGFFKKIAIPFGGKISIVKEKLDGDNWHVHMRIICSVFEGEGFFALEEKGKVNVDFITRSDTPFKVIDNTTIHYIVYDKEEEIFGFVLDKEDNKEPIFFTADCENVAVIFSEI